MSFKALSEAWRNASITDRKKFLMCMKHPLEANLNKQVPLEYALEALAYDEEKN